ncbi:hypothetical protein WJX79_002908 [Trebouxia sp. C0005]
MADLHAYIIAVDWHVSLAAELDLLLHLLALPSAVVCAPTVPPDTQPMFASGAVAALYASTVLCLSGQLIAALGKSMLEILAELPILSQHAPNLRSKLQQELDRLEENLLASNKAYSRPASSHLYGAGAFTQDGQRQRSQEEQRKVSNMNDCRDAWARVMRTAADQQAQPLQVPSAAQSKARLQLDPISDANAGVLLYMQQNVRKPLRALRPDNYATFAELFATALLQAAATGETLLDQSESTQKLQQLADKDTSKFYRLNQRMQGQAPGHRPSHQGSHRLNTSLIRCMGARLQQMQQQAVQASISAETAPWDGKRLKLKGIRKIHPSQPPGVSPNIQALTPPAVAAAADMPSHDNSSQDSVKEKLQEAFLEQYSGAGHKVRLRDVSDYITSIIAENAVSSSIERCAPQIVKSAAADMTAQGESAYQEAAAQSEQSNLGRSSPSALQSQHADICLDNIASDIVNSSVTQAMEVCFAAAEEAVNKQAVRALTALAAPQWTPSVIGTAAAMVAETARHRSAQQIIAQVSSAVRKQIQQQVDNANRAVVKAIAASDKSK